MVARKKKSQEYPDDIFADTRMTFGEHIEELRFRMIRALMWLLLFLVIGFIPAEKVAGKDITTTMLVYPGHISYLSTEGEGLLGAKKYMSTLSVQEGFVVYFKVSILCGIVLASPMILYQFWAFVGAGLYPHEKKYVYMFFGPSVVLFILGVLLCQFLVLPNAVKALLAFNEMLGFDPDIRLNEW